MKVSIIVSVYNEVLGIKKFYQSLEDELQKIKGIKYEIIFIDDGSVDGSTKILYDFALKNKLVKVIKFSRNFGHEAAMTAGLDNATGDVLIFMDADLQHPPKLIKSIIDEINDDYDIITMVREKNKSAGFIKNITSTGFYHVINKLSDFKLKPNVSDFFAITKEVQDCLRKNYRDKIRFLRGYVQNIGYNKTSISYEADERIAGESHYSIKKLFKFSINSIMCFSAVPAKLGIYVGNITLLISLIILTVNLINRSFSKGYNLLILIVLFMFSILFYIIGILGYYISILFSEIKDNPIYIIEETRNFDTKDKEI